MPRSCRSSVVTVALNAEEPSSGVIKLIRDHCLMRLRCLPHRPRKMQKRPPGKYPRGRLHTSSSMTKPIRQTVRKVNLNHDSEYF